MSGWIKLHRQMLDSDLWKSEPFTRAQAWVDLLLLANHSKGFIRARGIRIDVNRGQVGTSKVELSKRWQWSRGKTTRFLDELEVDQQIVQQKNNVSSLIAITNYEQYQGNGTASDTADGQQTGQQTDSRQDTNKKNNNNKNDKEVKEVLSYLNEKLGKNFRVAKGLLKRFSDGYTVDDAKKVIDNKASEWMQDDKMKRYLTPDTLFSEKFDKYLNEAVQGDGTKRDMFNESYEV